MERALDPSAGPGCSPVVAALEKTSIVTLFQKRIESSKLLAISSAPAAALTAWPSARLTFCLSPRSACCVPFLAFKAATTPEMFGRIRGCDVLNAEPRLASFASRLGD